MDSTDNFTLKSPPVEQEKTDIIHEMMPLTVSNMLDKLSDIVIVCINGNIRHINKAGIHILGASTQEDLLGVNFQGLICDDFASSIDDILSVLADENNATPMHVKGISGSRSSLTVQVNHLPDLGEHAYLLTAQNITKHVKLSQAVRDSEARFGKLIDHALDFICVMKNGAITYINQAGLTLLHASSEADVIGQSLNKFMHPDYQGIMDGDLHELVTDTDLIPVRFIDTNKNPIDIELGIFILEDGDTPRYMIEARDITAHNRAVRALRHSIDNLEHRVEERTRELQEEINERRRAEEMLRHTASHDGLTDLPNRSLLMDRLNQATHRMHRNHKKCAVLFIDLDGFKPINDTLGHDIGDAVLRKVANRLNASIRETDTASRFGGDEFVLILTDLDSKDDAANIAEKILTKLAKPMNFDGTEAHVGASIGIAFYPDDGNTAEGILKKADNAMYDVKGSGKNAYIIADS